ncbi:MAG: hypothetical protein IPM92_09015 [Saprospiraceae bacterium]|nr:hypothetical protein [Saprospiraceae bacterium]
MQQVITVTIKNVSNPEGFAEFRFPQVKAALDDGYKIIQVHQIAFPGPMGSLSMLCLTFVLQKGS